MSRLVKRLRGMDLKGIEEKLLKYYNGKLSDAEAVEVEKWIDESEGNRRIARDVWYICFSADAMKASGARDTKAALNKVRRRIFVSRIVSLTRKVERVAAILFVPVVILSALLLRDRLAASSMIEMTANPGMTSKVTLPDNSVVWLNSCSTVKYPSRFGCERKVRLEGEAYFRVAEDRKKQFIVDAGKAEVKVYGTEFNIDAYDPCDIRASLVSGSISFGYDDMTKFSKHLMMKPSDQIAYNSKTGEVKLYKADMNRIVAWKDGLIILKDTSLKEALRQIGNRYNAEFRIMSPKLAEAKFTGTFSDQSLNDILRYFYISSMINFRPVRPVNGSISGRVVYEVI